MTKPKVTVSLTSDNQLTTENPSAVNGIATISVTDTLQAIETAIQQFKALPVWSVLNDDRGLPNASTIAIKHFLNSKDNNSALKNTAPIFASSDFVADFALPKLNPEPEIAEEELEDLGKRAEFILRYKDWAKTGAKEINDAINKTGRMLASDKIRERYASFIAIRSFVLAQLQLDPQCFDTEDLIELQDLPKNIRQSIVSAYQAKFAVNPVMFSGGNFVNLIDINPACALDTIAGIDAILAVKRTKINPTDPKSKSIYDGFKFSFLTSEIATEVLKIAYGKINYCSFRHLENCLISNGATSKNASTILDNFKKLLA